MVEPDMRAWEFRREVKCMAETYREQIIDLLNEIDDADISFFRQIRIMIKTHLQRNAFVGKEVSRNENETGQGAAACD